MSEEIAPVEMAPESGEVSVENDSGKGIEKNGEGVESFDSWLARQKDEVKAGAIKPKEEPDLLGSQPEKEPIISEEKEPEPVVEEPKVVEEAPEIKELKTAHESLTKEHETLQSQVKDLVQSLQKDPGAVLDHLNVPRDLIEQWYFEKYVKPETMTVEEKLAQYQEREAKQKEEAARAEQERLEQERVAANREHWSKKIQEGITAAGLPHNDFTVSRVAAHLKAALDRGIAAQVADVVPAVQKELEELQVTKSLKDLPVEKLIATLGEEALAKIRSHEVNKLRQANKFAEGEKKGTAVKREPKQENKKRYSNPYQLLDDL
jgi:IgA-specific serine endopeptidase